MEGFFKEHELNKTSKNKKIRWIFHQLLIERSVDEIILNYPDIEITKENEQFTIKGTDFLYQFGETELSLVWKRMKKVTK